MPISSNVADMPPERDVESSSCPQDPCTDSPCDGMTAPSTVISRLAELASLLLYRTGFFDCQDTSPNGCKADRT